jgi:hypothetical protein
MGRACVLAVGGMNDTLSILKELVEALCFGDFSNGEWNSGTYQKAIDHLKEKGIDIKP